MSGRTRRTPIPLQSITPLPSALGQEVTLMPATFPWFSNAFNHGMTAVAPALCGNVGRGD